MQSTKLEAELTSTGRFGPRTSIRIEFGADGRFVDRGGAEPADASALVAVLGCLAEAAEPLDAAAIAAAAGKDLKTVQNALSRLLGEMPCRLDTVGTGHRGDPRRYSLKDRP